MLDEPAAEINFILAKAKSDLRASLSDALRIIRLAGDAVSPEEHLSLLVATSMLTLSNACAETALLISKLTKESTR